MKSFKDDANRTWDITINVSTIKRIRSRLNVDLLSLGTDDADKKYGNGGNNTPPLLVQLATDLVLLSDIIFVCVLPQAESLNITDEQFGEALGGGSIYNAREAFFAELVDFFLQSGRKDVARAIQGMVQMMKSVIESVTTKVQKTLDTMDPEQLVTSGMSGN